MPFKQLSLRKEDAVLKPPDPEPLDVFFHVRARPEKGSSDRKHITRLHFNADADSAQSYAGDTESVVMEVYGNNNTIPQESDRACVYVNHSHGYEDYWQQSDAITITVEGCDGMTYFQQGEASDPYLPSHDYEIVFAHPPTTPGKMTLTFPLVHNGPEVIERDEPYTIEIAVTTDFEEATPAPPPQPIDEP